MSTKSMQSTLISNLKSSTDPITRRVSTPEHGNDEASNRDHMDGMDLTGKTGQMAAERGPETRTTGFDGHSCTRCGKQIKGRRRNGYCSDKCRMRDARDAEAETRFRIVARLKAAVAEVERELIGEVPDER
jgi:hypothetical protein